MIDYGYTGIACMDKDSTMIKRMKEYIKLNLSLYWSSILYGIYFSFCDRKVLHNVVKPPRLLFDPLFAKFSQENKKNYENAVYIEKTLKNYYIMDMKILKRYTKDEVISELLEKCPILKYHSEDDIYYEMVYYGNLPILYNEYIKNSTFIRFYYHMETKSFYYIARICGKERRREYRCDLWSMEQVIEHFKKDIEKSKKWKEQQKIDKIKEDF